MNKARKLPPKTRLGDRETLAEIRVEKRAEVKAEKKAEDEAEEHVEG